MTPEVIGALLAAATGLMIGLTQYFNKRSQSQRDELERVRNENVQLRQQLRLADQWIFKMTRFMDQNGLEGPSAPKGLLITSGDADDGDQA